MWCLLVSMAAMLLGFVVFFIYGLVVAARDRAWAPFVAMLCVLAAVVGIALISFPELIAEISGRAL